LHRKGKSTNSPIPQVKRDKWPKGRSVVKKLSQDKGVDNLNLLENEKNKFKK